MERFQLGTLNDEQSERVDSHLEACRHCAEQVNRFDQSADGLMAAIRNSLAAGGACAATSAPGAPPTIPRPPLPSPPQEAPNLDFLDAAEHPDELGRFGSYRVLEVLGVGGMGIVLLAEDVSLERRVALKVMLPELAKVEEHRRRFLREARATAAVEHPRIVPIYQIGEVDKLGYLAMPLLKGESLDTRLKREQRLPITEAVRIARQIAEGLDAAHEHGLIHRDIKPGNIWLDEKSGDVTILDFGLARHVADDAHITRPDTVVGTPAYMAPEQAANRPLDHRCDLFSLGTVLYRMLTGALPFTGNDTMSMLMMLAIETPRPLREWHPGAPAPLDRLLAELLAKDPAARPAAARNVVAALDKLDQRDFLEDDKTEQLGAPAQRSAMTARSSRTGKWWAIGGSLAALAVGLLVFVVSRESGSVPDRQSKASERTPANLESKEKRNSSTDLARRLANNDLGMEFVRVPRGKFRMGGGAGKPAGRWVFVPTDFYLGKYEVTQEQWVGVMGNNPSSFSRTGDLSKRVKNVSDADLNRLPVDSISWLDAQAFLEKLNTRDKLDGWVYRLPTEVEWEYACRGGPSDDPSVYGYDFYFENPTNTMRDGQANCWLPGNDWKRAFPVGSFQANRLGLHDMHGNVPEWCADEVGREGRPFRGGVCTERPAHAAAALRIVHQQGNHASLKGIRVALVPADAELPRFSNELGMEFVHVSRGKFLMGGEAGVPGKEEVTIPHDFYIGVTEVTQEQWQVIMGENPSYFSRTGAGKNSVAKISNEELEQFPVDSVSWEDTQRFIKKLNQQTRERGWIYRLPTQTEWEYACRGGPPIDAAYGRFSFYLEKPANQLQREQANFKSASHLQRTCRVASYHPNRLGLYDLHGNLWEWCQDKVEHAKPTWTRVARGGCWHGGSEQCRADSSVGSEPSRRHEGHGLRLVRVPAK